MKFTISIKERIARVIGTYFTTNDIVNVFKDADIPTDVSLYAKWRITLDAFSKMSNPQEDIPRILETFCHPLNFENNQVRNNFVEEINTILAYDDLKIEITNRTAKIISTDGSQASFNLKKDEIKTSTDYIREALTFFKNEYNKVRIVGLKYEYSIGESSQSEQTNQDYDDYNARLKAIERLKDAGFITEYTIETRAENDGYYIWDYAICKIDESKITQKEAPRPSEKKVKELIHKIEIVGGKGIEDLQDGLKSIARTKKEDKNKFPYKLPSGTRWENITIKFLDDESVYIQVKQFKHSANFKEMGMVGRGKNPNPSEAWIFLKVLAKMNGELTIKDSEAKDKYKKQKELLAKALQNYFSIDYDPFYPYQSSTEKGGNSYKIKLTLIPLQAKKEEGSDENDDLGIKEHWEEQAPQVIEDQWRN